MKSKTSHARSLLFIISISAFSFLLFFSCDLYNKKASPEKDKAAKAFMPEPQKAILYIYRILSPVAAIQAFRLYLDGQAISDCTSGTFVRLAIEPGAHIIGVGNVSSPTPSKESVSIKADEGNIYYIELSIGASPISGIPKLKIADEQAAKRDIQNCSLIE